MSPTNKLTSIQPKGKFLSVENLREFLGGKLPLSLLHQTVIDYIDDRIADLAPGGSGTLADAHNFYGSGSTAGTSTIVSSGAVTGYKLRGFHLHGTGDAVVTLSFTDSGGGRSIKAETDNITRMVNFSFPNPIVVTDGSTITIVVVNGSGASADYYGVIFGEDTV